MIATRDNKSKTNKRGRWLLVLLASIVAGIAAGNAAHWRNQQRAKAYWENRVEVNRRLGYEAGRRDCGSAPEAGAQHRTISPTRTSKQSHTAEAPERR